MGRICVSWIRYWTALLFLVKQDWCTKSSAGHHLVKKSRGICPIAPSRPMASTIWCLPLRTRICAPTFQPRKKKNEGAFCGCEQWGVGWVFHNSVGQVSTSRWALSKSRWERSEETAYRGRSWECVRCRMHGYSGNECLHYQGKKFNSHHKVF